MNEFENELRALINRHSQENKSNTPDFILAAYIGTCLAAFNDAVRDREQWYGRDPNAQPGTQPNSGTST